MFSRQVRRIIAGSCLGLLLLVSAIPCQTALVGNKNTKKYHLTSCQFIKSMKPEHLVKLNSAKEAKAAGYVACKVCKPPEQ